MDMWVWAEFEKEVRKIEKDSKEIKNDKTLSRTLIYLVNIILFAVFLRYSNALLWVLVFILFFFHDVVSWKIQKNNNNE
jgi:hypothetical protein